jgi:hypothetical protein
MNFLFALADSSPLFFPLYSVFATEFAFDHHWGLQGEGVMYTMDCDIC